MVKKNNDWQEVDWSLDGATNLDLDVDGAELFHQVKKYVRDLQQKFTYSGCIGFQTVFQCT